MAFLFADTESATSRMNTKGILSDMRRMLSVDNKLSATLSTAAKMMPAVLCRSTRGGRRKLNP